VTEAHLHAQRFDDRVVVSINGEIDLENAGRTRDGIVKAVSGTPRRIVLDLSDVGHIDSAGIRLLFDLAGRLEERRLSLAIVAPSKSLLREVLEVVRLERVAAVVESLDDALRLPARTSVTR
jgi:anti-anti-sigma factor